MASQSGDQDAGGATMSRRQAERAEYGMSLNEVLGDEKNYLGMLGGYNGGSTSGQEGGSWVSRPHYGHMTFEPPKSVFFSCGIAFLAMPQTKIAPLNACLA